MKTDQEKIRRELLLGITAMNARGTFRYIRLVWRRRDAAAKRRSGERECRDLKMELLVQQGNGPLVRGKARNKL